MDNFVFSVGSINELAERPKMSIKVLMGINALCYLHIFYLYFYIGDYIEVVQPVNRNIFWMFLVGSVLHLVFLGITTLFFNFKKIRSLAIIDWVLRVVAYILVFERWNVDFLLSKSTYIFAILISLALISLLLELWMYQKADVYRLKKKMEHIEVNPTEKEIKNIHNMEKALVGFLGVLLVYGGLGLGTTIDVSSTSESTLRTLLTVGISVSSFLWFISTIYNKYQLFYQDKRFAQRIFMKNTVFISVGYVLCLLGGLGLLGPWERTTDIAILLGIVTLIPAVKTNRQMAIRLDQLKNFDN